jgi:hypothetical protein
MSDEPLFPAQKSIQAISLATAFQQASSHATDRGSLALPHRNPLIVPNSLQLRGSV